MPLLLIFLTLYFFNDLSPLTSVFLLFSLLQPVRVFGVVLSMTSSCIMCICYCRENTVKFIYHSIAERSQKPCMYITQNSVTYIQDSILTATTCLVFLRH